MTCRPAGARVSITASSSSSATGRAMAPAAPRPAPSLRRPTFSSHSPSSASSPYEYSSHARPSVGHLVRVHLLRPSLCLRALPLHGGRSPCKEPTHGPELTILKVRAPNTALLLLTTVLLRHISDALSSILPAFSLGVCPFPSTAWPHTFVSRPVRPMGSSPSPLPSLSSECIRLQP